MTKKLFTCLIACLTLLSILAACGGTTTSAPAASGASSPQVHMGDNNFNQASITIQKGQSITLVDDSSVPHVIANGMWKNGSPDPSKESGAPTVNNVQVNDNGSQTIGPFNSAGTFHLYCCVPHW